ncbi:MAG: DUF89 family protein [Deltaproteobacteria bacterium]|nr:DUF89 family protein [Deltaproteobacteria bacterium]
MTKEKADRFRTQIDNIQKLEPFPRLLDPAGYTACSRDLKALPEQRRYWLGLFREHFEKLVAEAGRVLRSQGHSQLEVQRRLSAARGDFYAFIARAETEPEAFPALDILQICLAREAALRAAAIEDPYLLIKQRENTSALELWPLVVQTIERLRPSKRIELLVRGIFAGNLFDLGAVEAAERFASGSVDFFATQRALKPRPWLIDDLDAFSDRMAAQPPYRAACLFADNAGFDIILGVLPFARELLERGTKVILASNSAPALNDITHVELIELCRRIAKIDDPLARALTEDRLVLHETGCTTPLIDLKRSSVELCRAVRGLEVDLVVLEGMGRSLQSNFDAAFSCDALKIAMIKSPEVAKWLSGSLYDLVIKYEARR